MSPGKKQYKGTHAINRFPASVWRFGPGWRKKGNALLHRRALQPAKNAAPEQSQTTPQLAKMEPAVPLEQPVAITLHHNAKPHFLITDPDASCRMNIGPSMGCTAWHL